MKRSFRSVMILLLVFTFSVASTGWSIAGAAMAAGGSKGHHAPVTPDHPGGGHEHGDDDVAQHPVCLESNSSDCGAGHDHDDVASSCCAMACHTAIPAHGYSMTVIETARAIDPVLLEIGVKEASGTRFERPPRSTGILIVG